MRQRSEQRTSTELTNCFNKCPGLSLYAQVPEVYWLLVQAEISSTASSDADGAEDPQELYDSGSRGD